ncbi:Osmosensitive K+ channel histidine kinase KdpD [hydrothermal vent metagenome]|uniref:Osmosensitive K+ channel histidine kinase KdpD n=1 Tax=hydrothermal vent metagenome TaxID=652676 RepID=A0A3B1CG25_9ZZZZ
MSHKQSRLDDPKPFPKRVKYTTSRPAVTFLKFKYIIILFLLIIGIIPGLLGLAGIYRASEKELIEYKGLYFMEVASFTAFQVEQILDNELETIQRFARLPTIKNILIFQNENTIKEIEHLRKIIMPELARRYFVTNIFNNSGNLVFSSMVGGQVSSLDLSGEALADVMQKGMMYVTDVLETSLPDKQYYIEIFAPIKEDDGAIIGMIQARYTIDQLFDTIKNVTIGRSGHANLIVSTGDILVCPIFPPRSHKVGAGLLQKIAKGSPGWAIANDDGHGSSGTIVGFSPVRLTKKSLSYNSFENKKWFVFTRQEPYETYESIKKLQTDVTLYAGLFILLVFGIAAFAFRQIVNAQQSHQSEVVYKEKAESIKQILANFQQLMFIPLEEIRKGLEDIEGEESSREFNRSKLKKAKKSLLDMNSLIEHLAYYTQADRYDMEPVDLAKVVNDSLSWLDFIMGRKHIAIRLEKPEEPVLLRSQTKLLNVVVMNILLNAMHSMDNAGEIKIIIRKTNGWGVCEIQDHGTGIPAEDMENIFDPFFTTKKGRKGHGLGLSVSRGIIENHGGQISIKSAKDEGTLIEIKLKLWESN